MKCRCCCCAGISCATCHTNGASNAKLFVPGLSTRPGNFDTTGALFNPKADNHVLDPVRIPSLRGARYLAPYGHDGRIASLRTGIKMVLKDLVTGEPITEPSTAGEICVRGGVTTPGYHNDPERTADAFDDEGFLHTRDLASMDDDGWFWLGGRTDDIINTGAEKLSLLEVEGALRRHSDVLDVACVGVGHARFGEAGSDRASWNHGWSAEVWFITRSAITRMPRSWAASMNARKSSTVP